MGITLYKAGSTRTVNGIKCDLCVFDEQSYLQYLDLGWHYSPAACYESVAVEMSDEEIRADAKAKGIKNWYNKKIDKLKAEIEACQPEI